MLRLVVSFELRGSAELQSRALGVLQRGTPYCYYGVG